MQKFRQFALTLHPVLIFKSDSSCTACHTPSHAVRHYLIKYSAGGNSVTKDIYRRQQVTSTLQHLPSSIPTHSSHPHVTPPITSTQPHFFPLTPDSLNTTTAIFSLQ